MHTHLAVTLGALHEGEIGSHSCDLVSDVARPLAGAILSRVSMIQTNGAIEAMDRMCAASGTTVHRKGPTFTCGPSATSVAP